MPGTRPGTTCFARGPHFIGCFLSQTLKSAPFARVSKDGPRASWFETAQAPPHHEGLSAGRRPGLGPPGKSGDPAGDLAVQSPLQKYFCFSEIKIRLYDLPSRPTQRALAIVTDVGTGSGGRGWCQRREHLKRTAKSCGPDASTPASSLREQAQATVTRKPDHWGELEVSRKLLRRECRIASAEPVCSCAFFCARFARETAGAARTRCSLRPLIKRVRKFFSKPRAYQAARSRSHVSTSLRGAKATKQSIFPVRGAMDCFAGARNDGYD
jgi:hypothetical protein